MAVQILKQMAPCQQAAAAAAGRAAVRQAARTKKSVKELQRPQGVAKIDLSTVWGGEGSPSLLEPGAPKPDANAGVRAAHAGRSRLGNAPSGALPG